MNQLAERVLESRAMQQAFDTPMPATWVKDDPAYKAAEQCKEIGRVLIDKVHKHLVNAKIGYLFKQTMGNEDRVTLGKASKVGGKLQFYTGYDFVVEFNWTAWQKLKSRQRVALVDHELCHFGTGGEHDDTYTLLHHDVEEFGAIVTRWGCWKPDLTRFHSVMVAQTDLFTEDPQGPAPAEADASDDSTSPPRAD